MFPRLQVRNEISVLKRVSKGHRNIVTLHDYFEVSDIRWLASPSIHFSRHLAIRRVLLMWHDHLADRA